MRRLDREGIGVGRGSSVSRFILPLFSRDTFGVESVLAVRALNLPKPGHLWSTFGAA